MTRDDAAKNCTWVTRGFYSRTYGMDAEELADHHKEHGTVEDPTKDPCKMVHEQAKAWNALTLKHKNNDKMVFGDVVVSDWPQAVNESHHLYQAWIAEAEGDVEEEMDPDEQAHLEEMSADPHHEVYDTEHHPEESDDEEDEHHHEDDEHMEHDADTDEEHHAEEAAAEAAEDEHAAAMDEQHGADDDNHEDDDQQDDGDAHIEDAQEEEHRDDEEQHDEHPDTGHPDEDEHHEDEYPDVAVPTTHGGPTMGADEVEGDGPSVDGDDTNPTPGEPGEGEGEGDGYGDEAHEGDWEPGHGDDEEGFIAHEKPDWIFGEELSEVANDPDVGGCTIRSYNQQNGYTHGWSPHCHELLEVHDVSEDEAPDSEEEDHEGDAAKRALHEVMGTRMELDAYIADTVESLDQHFEMLGHLDQL